ncbi:MAG: transporter, family [Desulfovibrionales bacterium]|nr:transporter, family [Desulfovibrionales bacterium]
MTNKSLIGWKLYDFANSAYILTIATALLPAWFASVVAGPLGVEAFGVRFSASTLWGLAVSAAAAVVFALAPVLGAVADMQRSKKKFWAALCAGGCLFAALLGLPGRGDVWQCLGLFVAAQVCFAGANVFYDAFLPELAPADRWDALSGQGFAWGYVGGGLHFALCLVLVAFHQAVGLDKAQAVRLSMVSAAAWWIVFSIPAFLWIDESKAPTPGPGGAVSARRALRLGLLQAVRTLKALLQGTPASRFLLAYLLFNDGVQTVIAMAAIYGKEELALPETALMTTLLLVQAVAMAGALIFGRVAGRTGAKRALSLSLVLWCAIAAWAAFIHTAGQYMALGCGVGLVLGATQALSRSFFASLVPANETAQYFGYFSVVSKLSAILGPLVFAGAAFVFGSARPAAPVMAVFFLTGLWLLNKVRPETDNPTTDSVL